MPNFSHGYKGSPNSKFQIRRVVSVRPRTAAMVPVYRRQTRKIPRQPRRRQFRPNSRGGRGKRFHGGRTQNVDSSSDMPRARQPRSSPSSRLRLISSSASAAWCLMRWLRSGSTSSPRVYSPVGTDENCRSGDPDVFVQLRRRFLGRPSGRDQAFHLRAVSDAIRWRTSTC